MKKKISLVVLVSILAIGLVGAVVYYHLGFRQRAEVKPVVIVKVFFDHAHTQKLKQGATQLGKNQFRSLDTDLIY